MTQRKLHKKIKYGDNSFAAADISAICSAW